MLIKKAITLDDIPFYRTERYFHYVDKHSLDRYLKMNGFARENWQGYELWKRDDLLQGHAALLIPSEETAKGKHGNFLTFNGKTYSGYEQLHANLYDRLEIKPRFASIPAGYSAGFDETRMSIEDYILTKDIKLYNHELGDKSRGNTRLTFGIVGAALGMYFTFRHGFNPTTLVELLWGTYGSYIIPGITAAQIPEAFVKTIDYFRHRKADKWMQEIENKGISTTNVQGHIAFEELYRYCEGLPNQESIAVKHSSKRASRKKKTRN